MNKQQIIGRWVMGLGQLLLFGVFVYCCIDVWGFSSRNDPLASLSSYLGPIFVGVALQFVGSAIGHMQFKVEKSDSSQSKSLQ